MCPYWTNSLKFAQIFKLSYLQTQEENSSKTQSMLTISSQGTVHLLLDTSYWHCQISVGFQYVHWKLKVTLETLYALCSAYCNAWVLNFKIDFKQFHYLIGKYGFHKPKPPNLKAENTDLKIVGMLSRMVKFKVVWHVVSIPSTLLLIVIIEITCFCRLIYSHVCHELTKGELLCNSIHSHYYFKSE